MNSTNLVLYLGTTIHQNQRLSDDGKTWGTLKEQLSIPGFRISGQMKNTFFNLQF
jgi:hypothetical protein